MNNKFNNLTLDNKHNKITRAFENNKKLIPKYNLEIEKLESKLKNNNNNNSFEIREKIIYYNNLIKKIENESINYYLDNSRYIFEYFEDKKAITNIDKNVPSINNIINNKKIENFFNINKDGEEYNNKNSLLDKYFTNTEKNYLNYDNFCYHNDICRYCKSGEMIFNEADGIYVCNNCCRYLKYFIDNEKTSYREPPKEVCFYAYKRINHLKEILAQFQAKESTKIPEYIFDTIKNQIKKERIQLKDLTNEKTKEILKNLGYNKYYEHIPFIKDKLGIPPPVMSNELEETLCNLFMEIQKPYSKYCPSNRVNFLNYYYTIYKLCEMLKQSDFLPYFPMLKDREKRIEQDQIWKKICEELNWQFIPTI
tara:strand:+ start:2495 stop:3595 length:1101 start_codon:yes stop_codon:yes gene_type:complete